MTQPASPGSTEAAASSPDSRGPSTPLRLPHPWTRRGSLPAVLALTAVALAISGGVLWWQQTHLHAGRATLEPQPATASILIPAEDAPASAPAPAAAASVPALSVPADDRLASLHASVEQLVARVIALEDADRSQVGQITTLRTEVERLTDQRHSDREKAAEHTKRATSAAETSSRQLTRTAAVPAPAPAAAASILAVDLWGGQPSVVVTKDGTDGKDVRFINQGETQGRVTLKSADVGSQRAMFATPSGEFTMHAGER